MNTVCSTSRRMGKFFVLIVIFAAMSCVANAACTGTSPNFSSTLDAASIKQCFANASHSGDTITLAAGTGHIATQLSWTAPANAMLIGAGTSAVGGGDQTILIDDDTANQTMLDIGTNASGTFRMTGITIKGGLGVLKDNGVIALSGTGAQTRIDHIHWDGTTYSTLNKGKWMQVTGKVYGVLDHSILDLQDISWTHFTNGGDFAGDANWAAPTDFGTAKFFFIEDNVINGHTSLSVYTSTLTDCHTGGRFVVRFNTLVATNISQTHPTGHSGDDRGCRAHENYGNLVTSPLAAEPNFAMEYSNSGAAMVWNNQALGVYKSIIYLNNCRQSGPGGPGYCGYDPDAPPANWGHCGTAYNGTGSAWDRNDVASLGRPCIDQPGRGQGDRITGIFPNKINSATGTIAWPHQALDPVYVWMINASIVPGWGGEFLSNNSTGNIVANADYYSQASGIQTSPTNPFNGTTGTGWGTLANRPSTCTTSAESGGGVGYFAIDQGSWNASTSNDHGVQMNGASGVLYRCVATNTWAAYYTPYAYPHPLTVNAGSGQIDNTPPTVSITFQ